MPWTPDSYYYFVLQGACKHHKIPTKILYKDLTDRQKNIILNGSEEKLSLVDTTDAKTLECEISRYYPLPQSCLS
jgi:excinuclease UvrABC ATPase subunit